MVFVCDAIHFFKSDRILLLRVSQQPLAEEEEENKNGLVDRKGQKGQSVMLPENILDLLSFCYFSASKDNFKPLDVCSLSKCLIFQNKTSTM